MLNRPTFFLGGGTSDIRGFLLFHLSICVTPIGFKTTILKNLLKPSIEESSCLNIAGLVVSTCVVVIYLVADR